MRTPVFALLLAACLRSASPAAAQAAAVTIPRGPVPASEAEMAARFHYVPTERALRWLPGDTLLVGHVDMYGGATAYYTNCSASGFFKVPLAGGSPVRVGGEFCALDRSVVAAEDGASVLYFGDPAYVRLGPSSLRADSPLLRLTLASGKVDTLRTGCGSGIKEIAVAGDDVAWTGRCWSVGELARTPACAAGPDGRIPQACSAEDRSAVYTSRPAGGEPRRLGEAAPSDVHEPSWSPDRRAAVVAVGPNLNQGRWELSRSAPSTLMIVDAGGARYIGAQGETAAWSPDGSWIAFFGEDPADVGARGTARSIGPRIYLIHPDGTGQREVFANDMQVNYPDWFWGGVALDEREGKVFGPIAWSPDSRWIAFSRQAEDGASIWRVEIETGRAERVTIPEG